MSLDSDPEIDAAFNGGAAQTSSAPVSDDPEIHAAFSEQPKSKDSKKRVSWAEENLAGPSEVIGSAIGNIPYGVAHGVHDLFTGGAPDPEGIKALQVPVGAGGKQLLSDIGSMLPARNDTNQPDDTSIPEFSEGTRNVIGHGFRVANDVGGIAAGAGLVKGLVGSIPKLGPTGAPVEEAQSAMNAAAGGKSMGAASTAADITGASPELQKAIVDTTRKTGGAVNPDVLNRRLEADSLPVKMNLTEGQATQDPSIISNEMNMRGKHKELADAYNQQNGQLVDNLRAIREQTGPDVFSTNPVEHGDTLIQAYKDKGAAADSVVSQNYKALKDAAGGSFPIDAPKLLDNATKELHKNLLFDDAPKSVMSTLGRLSDSDNMTFENFESLRSNLARIQRSPTADGNTKYAAGIIRDEMEKLPLSPGAAKLKPIADTARASAKAQFEALDADPAYKAAVTGDVPPDKFVSKFITGPSATRDSVAKMKENLSHDDRASQTLGVAAVDHLRDQAKIDSMGNGNFASATFNKHLEAMRPKLQSIVPPEQAQQLDTLGKVSRYTTAQPKGSFVNNSNTLVGALAGHGANVLEGVANVKAGGIPVGSMVRGALGKRAEAQAVKRALDPASGLENLKEAQ
jgi:hypothetical protein